MSSNSMVSEFLTESFENLLSIKQDLTILKTGTTNTELLNKMYRTAHTMKGSAGFIGHANMQELMHTCEDLLGELLNKKLENTAQTLKGLNDIFDSCTEILKCIEQGQSEVDIVKVGENLAGHNKDLKNQSQPLSILFTDLEKLVVSLTRQTGKEIKLQVFGAQIKVEKTLMRSIKDPLFHIVRNACDHGIETNNERQAYCKPIPGTIIVKAIKENDQVIIEISDNGRGLDRSKILTKAIDRGLFSQDILSLMSESEILNIVFKHGFSTLENVTNISGRGVGLDIVKTSIEKLGGTISIDSKLSKGTTLKVSIPGSD